MAIARFDNVNVKKKKTARFDDVQQKSDGRYSAKAAGNAAAPQTSQQSSSALPTLSAEEARSRARALFAPSAAAKAGMEFATKEEKETQYMPSLVMPQSREDQLWLANRETPLSPDYDPTEAKSAMLKIAQQYARGNYSSPAVDTYEQIAENALGNIAEKVKHPEIAAYEQERKTRSTADKLAQGQYTRDILAGDAQSDDAYTSRTTADVLADTEAAKSVEKPKEQTKAQSDREAYYTAGIETFESIPLEKRDILYDYFWIKQVADNLPDTKDEIRYTRPDGKGVVISRENYEALRRNYESLISELGKTYSADDLERMQNTLSAYANELNRAQSDVLTAKFATMQPIVASLGSIGGRMVGGITATADLIGQNLAKIGKEDGYKKPVDYNTWASETLNAANVGRGTVSENISYTAGDFASFIYDATMSIADTTITGALPGGKVLSSVSLVASTAFDSAKAAADRGAADWQALGVGLVSGALELAVEKIPKFGTLSRLEDLKEIPIASLGDLIRSTFASAHLEGCEEALTEILNRINECIWSPSTSSLAVAISEYEAQNNSFTDALMLAVRDMSLDVLKAYGGGFIGGAEMQGSLGTMNYALNSGTAKEYRDLFVGSDGKLNEATYNALMTKALSSKDEAVQKYAAVLADRRDSVTANEAGMLYAMVEASEEQVDFAAEIDSPARTVEETRSTFSKDGQTAFDIAMEGATDKEAAAREFRIKYLEGERGKAFEVDTESELTSVMQRAAHKLGAEAAKIVANPVKGEYNNTYTEANDGRKVYLRDGGERIDGKNTGKQVRVVEEGTGRNQSGQTKGKPRDSEAASLTLGKEVSTASFYIPNGSTADKIYRIAGGETTAMKQARMLARDRGLEVMFYAGGNMTIDGESVRGYINGNRVFIRADHPQFTADQIMRHEVGHDRIAKGEINLDRVRGKIKAKYGERFDEISAGYADAYEGTGLTADEIFEEMVCDSLGDMNIFDDFAVLGDAAGEFLSALNVEAEANANYILKEGNKDASEGRNKQKNNGASSRNQNTGMAKGESRATQESKREVDNLRERYSRGLKPHRKWAAAGLVSPKKGTEAYLQRNTVFEYNVPCFVVKNSIWDKHMKAPAFSVKGQIYFRETIPSEYKGAAAEHELAHVMKQLKFQPYLDFLDNTPYILNISNKDTQAVLDEVSMHVERSRKSQGVDFDVLNMSEDERMAFYDEFNAMIRGQIAANKIDTPYNLRDVFNDFNSYVAEFDSILHQFKESRKNITKYSREIGADLNKSAFSMDSEGNTLTEQQAEYFADSKVRDEDGNLLVVYHGTYEDFTVFDMSKGRANMDIQGSFFSPWELDAQGYGPNVEAYYLNIKKPATEKQGYAALSRFKGQNNAGVKAREYLISQGYDGVINSDEEYIAFYPEQIKRVDNKTPTSDPDIRYSRELGSLDNLHEVNEGLRERVAELEEQLKAKTAQAEHLKGQTKRTTLKSVRPEDVKAAARKLIADYGSEAKTSVIVPAMQKLGDYIVNAEHLDYTDLKDMAVPVAKEIVESSFELTNSEELATFKDIKAYLRGRTIAISNVDSHNIAEFERFRKHNFGRFTVSKTNGEPVDTVYQELNAAFGEYFPEDITHPADQLTHIAKVFDDMQPIYENPYSYNMAEAIEYCANAVIETVLSETVRQNPATFADRAAAKVDAAKAEGRRRLSELRAEKNERIAKLIKEGAERTRAAVKRERQIRDDKIRSLKEHYRDSRKKASESRKAAELRHKIMRHAKDLSAKLLKPTDKKHIPKDFEETVAALLEAINLESSRPGMDGMPSKRTKAFQALRDEYAKFKGEFVIDADLFGDSESGDAGLFAQVIDMHDVRIADMNEEQLNIVWQTMRAIEASIASYNKMFSAAKFATISDAAESLYKDNAGKKASAVYGGLLKPVNVFKNLTTLDMMTPETFLHMLGDAGDSLFRTMRDAQDKHIRIMAEIAEFTHEVMNKVDVRSLEKEMHTVTLGGENASLSTAQIMELYVLMRRDAAIEHILLGGILPETQNKKLKSTPIVEAMRGITEEELADAFSLLTVQQKQLADKLQNYLSVDMSRRGNEASMEVYGYEKFPEEFYWPIRVNKQEVKSDVGRDTSITTVANRGFTKATKPDAKNSVLIGSIFDTFANHSAEMATYAAWLGTSEDINRIRNFVFRDDGGDTMGTVKGIFDRVHGKGGSKYVEKLLSDIAVGVKASYTNPTDILTANTKAAAVAGNIRVIVQQPTAGLRALDMIDAKYFVAGMKPNKGWEKAKKYAPIAQWKDWGYFDIHTGRQMKDVLFDTDSKLDKTKNFFMWGASKADSLTWGMLWNACEVETKAKNKALEPNSEEFYGAVAKRFTEVIDHTQVVDGILQRSQIMRQSDALAKMASSFMGEPTKQYNMVMSAAYDARIKKPGAKKKLARTVTVLAISSIINAAAQSIIDAGRDDDREKEYWEKWLESFIGFTGEEKGFWEHFRAFWQGNVQSAFNPAQYIPYVKDGVSLLQGYDVSRMDMDGVSKFISAIGTMSKTISGEGKFTYIGATTNLIAEASRVLGIPFANLKRDVTAALNTYTNATNNTLMQYHLDKITYGITLGTNKGRYYDLAFEALRNDDMAAYNIIREDLLTALSSEIDGTDFDSAMRSRYKKVSSNEDFYMSQKAMDLIGIGKNYEVEKAPEAFGADDLNANEYKQYSEKRAEIYRDIVDDLEGLNSYHSFDNNSKNKMMSAVERLAEEYALMHASDEAPDVDIKWMLWATGGEDYGVDEAEAIMFKTLYDSVDGKDENGKSANGLKKERTLAAAEEKMPWLTEEELIYLKSGFWES